MISMKRGSVGRTVNVALNDEGREALTSIKKALLHTMFDGEYMPSNSEAVRFALNHYAAHLKAQSNSSKES